MGPTGVEELLLASGYQREQTRRDGRWSARKGPQIGVFRLPLLVMTTSRLQDMVRGVRAGEAERWQSKVLGRYIARC